MDQNPPKFSRDTLYCFYDLRYSPITFDFLHFLVFAEVVRRKRNFAHLSVLICTGDDRLFRQHTEKDVVLDDDEKLWRLRHVIAPACWSLPSCRGVWIAHDRGDVRGFHATLDQRQVFPLNYTPESPQIAFTIRQMVALHNAGCDLNVFEAPANAKRKVAEWVLANKIHRPIAALSLRYDQWHLWKNSNLNEWQKFEEHLLGQGLQPVVIPDTFLALRGLFPPTAADTKMFFQGSLDFELRAAMYDAAFVTISSHGGPAMYNLFRQDSRCLIFQGDEPNPNEAEFFRMWNVKWGDQPPWASPLQRIVFQRDSFENLVNSLDALIAEAGGVLQGDDGETQETE